MACFSVALLKDVLTPAFSSVDSNAFLHFLPVVQCIWAAEICNDVRPKQPQTPFGGRFLGLVINKLWSNLLFGQDPKSIRAKYQVNSARLYVAEHASWQLV